MTAQRIDAGPSAFELEWLADGVLAYESGAGAKASLNLYDVATRKKTPLPLKNGAGFVGIPTLTCGPAPANPSPPATGAPRPADKPVSPPN